MNEENIERRVMVPISDLPQDLTELELALVANDGGKFRRILRLERDLLHRLPHYSRRDRLT